MTRLKNIIWESESYLYYYAQKLKRFSASKRHSFDGHVVVSLTSYHKKFPYLESAIRSLLLQNVKPDKLVLWITKEDFKLLPHSITRYEREFEHFTIEECQDFRSYKKLVPSIEMFPQSSIITADDDIIYPVNWLAQLLDEATLNPGAVVAYRCRNIALDLQTQLPLPYIHWPLVNDGYCSSWLLPTTGGGVVYPPKSLSTLSCDPSLFLQLAPTSDDIWFYWMARMNGTKICKTSASYNLVNVPKSHRVGLAQTNIGLSGNDTAVQKLQIWHSLF